MNLNIITSSTTDGHLLHFSETRVCLGEETGEDDDDDFSETCVCLGEESVVILQ